MKNAMLIGTGALLLLFGVSAPAFAQEQHDPQEQPAKPPEGKPTDKPQAEQPKTPDDRARPDKPRSRPRKPSASPKPSVRKKRSATSTPATGAFLMINTARTSAANTPSTSATR